METQHYLKTVEKAPRQSDASIEAAVGVTPSPALAQQQRPRSNEAADHFMSQVCSKSPVSNTVSSSKVSVIKNDHSLPTTTTSTASSSVVATMNDDHEDNDVRRSGRQCTSRVVQIDGHTVLKENNYVLKGLSYMFGDNTVVQAPAKKRKAATKTSNKHKPKVPRVAPPEEVSRQAHNSMIRKRVANKAKARLEHLARHVKTLQPFLDTASQANLSAPVKAATEKRSELFLQPEAIQADLRDYQLAGLNWMVKMHDKNLGMILGDEMGLGKTLQTISLLCYLKEKEGITGPSLVICPLSVLYSWCNELKKWAPSLKVLRFHSSCSEEREAQKHTFQKDSLSYDVVVTTYEMAKQPQLRGLWSRQYFNYLVLDEGHKIKDASSQISQAVRHIHRENALILTGTPLQNNLVELWSLLNFLYPDVFVASEPFAEAFDIGQNVVNKETLQSAQKLLSLFMLRRLKDEVEKLMPKKIETKVLCPLSSTQIFWYKALLMKDIGMLARSVGDETTPAVAGNKAKMLNNLIMQLRKCCLHPYLFQGAEANIAETTVEDLIAASGKLAVLDKLLLSLYQKGHRTVLFSQFTSVLDILEDYCALRGWNYCRFDGSTARATRNYIVNSFNEPGSQKFIFLMSTRSGGMGLNLQTADTCILYDSDWNPQPDLQAMARVHRIGQTKTVHVYRLVTNGTIEERMVERSEKKLFMDRMVNTSGGGGMDGDIEVTSKDLVSTLRFGCNAVFGQDAETKNKLPTNDDIETITDRSRTEDFSDGNLKGGVASKTDDFDADKDLTSTTKLAGIDFKAIRAEHAKKDKCLRGPTNLGGISLMWQQIQDQKRKRKSRLVMVDGKNSGYGAASVPVLASNNYDLENGESSVFSRELKKTNRDNYGLVKRKVKKSGVDFENQEFCQVCGDGGDIVCCPRCPVSVHVHFQCSGVSKINDFMCCSHHRCVKCNKNTQAAGGLLFACESCPSSYCEDCIPPKAIFLGESERFKKLGWTTKNMIYIHCSKACNNIAKTEFGWKKPSRAHHPCPPPMDVSMHFGKKIDEALEARPEETETRLRPRKPVKYGSPPGASIDKKENGVINKAAAAATMHKKIVGKLAAGSAVVDLTMSPSPSPTRFANAKKDIALPKQHYEIVKNGDVRTTLI